MQDDRRAESGAGPYGAQFKVQIPRLPARRAPPPTAPKSRQRDRVQRACRNCHKRKIKCTGGLPRCSYCEKTEKTCIYERPRKDRLATATDRNQHLVSVLKDLSLRVSDEDRRRIEEALQDSDDEVDSPASMSSSRASVAQQYQQHSRLQPFASSSGQAAETSPTSDRSSVPRLDGVLPELDCTVDDEDTEKPDVVEAGFLGQISEVQWLQSLRHRVQVTPAVFTVAGDVSAHTSQPVSPIYGASSASVASNPPRPLAPTSYYLDDEGVKLASCGNPFELPPEHTAGLLFQCYTKTVQGAFPMVPETLGNQLQQYYSLVRNGQSIHCPEKWFALVNLVFAIGAKFSHLTQMEWQADELDHVIYLSRAFQLLSLNDTIVVLSTPDLPAIQAAGLFAFYYLISGQVNRAWVMVGIALRSSFSLGLHVQDPDISMMPAKRLSMVRTWWSLHALESLLSSMTGRPNIIPNEDITTALPSSFFDEQTQNKLGKMTNPVFMDADCNLNLLTQQVISSLYTQRRTTPTWENVQQTIVALVGELDKWAVDSIPHFHGGRWNLSYDQQREGLLLKLQYYRLKILITRPSLRRIERCLEAGTDDYNSLDQSVAETCIHAAQDVAAHLAAAPDIKTLYEKGPWWSVVHNIMQALAILMNAISCAENFNDKLKSSADSAKQLVGWLWAMRATNAIAARAYELLYSIVKTSKPFIWADLAGAFPDDIAVAPQPLVSGKVDPQYLPWPEQSETSETLFRYESDGFGNYQYHLL